MYINPLLYCYDRANVSDHLFVHHSWCMFYVFSSTMAYDYWCAWLAPDDFSMIIREVSASNPSFTHILVNGKNVGTRNHVIAVIYEDLGTPEEIMYVKETYAGGGYIIAVKQTQPTVVI